MLRSEEALLTEGHDLHSTLCFCIASSAEGVTGKLNPPVTGSCSRGLLRGEGERGEVVNPPVTGGCEPAGDGGCCGERGRGGMGGGYEPSDGI